MNGDSARDSGVSGPATPAVLIWPPSASEYILWLDDDAARAKAEPTAVPTAPPQPDVAVPLSRLMSSDVSIDWHDALALVQQVADQLAPDKARPPAGSVPPIEAIRLEPSGRLQVNLNPAGEPIVRGLGRLLTALLRSNPASTSLQLLAWRAATAWEAPLGLEDFCRQLAEWEQPGRAVALSALYARAFAAQSSIGLPMQSVQRVAPLVRPPIATDPPMLRRARRRTRAMAGLAASACIAVSAATFGVYSVRHSATESVFTARAAGHDIGLPPTTAGRRPEGRDAARLVQRSAPPTGTIRQGVGSRTDTGPVPVIDRRPAPAIDTASASAFGTEPAPAIESDREVAPPGPLALFPAQGPIAIPDKRERSIFTSDDAAVTEPVLVRPYPPVRERPGTPAGERGVLELVVDTRGMVESVQLKNPANRYRERWWVFAAKEWQFRPALKDGKPVRFLKRIPLTELNMLEPQ